MHHREGTTGTAIELALRRRRNLVARHWHEAIAPTSVTAWSPTQVARHLETWVDQAISTLIQDSAEWALARSIGAGLARLRYLQPETLDRTLVVLGQQLVAELPAAAVVALQPRMTTLLGAIASGFFRQAQVILLAEQESVHRATASERDEVAAALGDSEARYHAIFNDSALGIALIDTNGNLLETNPALSVMLGYDADELRHQASTAITHPDDVTETRRLFHELVAGQRDSYQLGKRYLHKEGHVIWARLTVSLVRDASRRPQFAVALVEDVTARRQAESERRDAYRHLAERAEAERIRLAQELHDGAVQDLQGVRLQISALQAARAYDSDGVARIEEIQNIVQKVIDDVRTLSTELRPPALEHFGLAPTLRFHVLRLQRAHPGLQFRLDIMPDGELLPEPVRLAFFRIYQEAVRNAVQHAIARQVWIRLAVDTEQVTLEVRDDGRGFVVPMAWLEMVREGHFGLLGAEERAKAAGGQLEVTSAPGSGTLVRVVVPCPEKPDPQHARTREDRGGAV